MLIKKCIVIRLFRGRKNSHWENRLSRLDNFICCHFLVNGFHSRIKKVFTDNQPKFTRIEHFLTHRESQWVSGSCYVTSKLLLKTSKFWPVLSFFFLIMRIRNLQYDCAVTYTKWFFFSVMQNEIIFFLLAEKLVKWILKNWRSTKTDLFRTQSHIYDRFFCENR